MKKLTLLATLTATLGLLAAPAVLRAQSIGARYYDGSAVNTLAATDVAGAPNFTQANWNNLTTASNTALRNNLGTATTLTATLAATAATQGDTLTFSPVRSGSVAGADERLNNGVVYTQISSLTLTLANIPYSSYSLVVYSLNAVTSAPVRLTLGTGTVLWLRPPPNPIAAGYLDNNAATPFTYTQSTGATQAAAPANSDFVVFTGLTGLTQTLTLLGNDPGDGLRSSSFQAFQIINTSAVPEPGTWALLGLGTLGLGVAALRRRRAA